MSELSTWAGRLSSEPFPPISRLILALYAGASGDHNPLHIDPDAAREAGLDDVIAHGMLPMAYLGRFLTEQFPLLSLRRFSARFIAMTHVGDRLTCHVEPIDANPGDGAVRLALSVVDQHGDTKLLGVAEIDEGSPVS